MEEFEDSRRFSRDKSGNWPDGRFGSRCCPDGILPIGWSDSYRNKVDDEQWNPIGIPPDLESGMEGDEVDDVLSDFWSSIHDEESVRSGTT